MLKVLLFMLKVLLFVLELPSTVLKTRRFVLNVLLFWGGGADNSGGRRSLQRDASATSTPFHGTSPMSAIVLGRAQY